KAFYRPRNTFRSAAHQLARYAISDGQAGVRWARMLRNAARCVAEIAAAVLLAWTWIPLAVDFVLECWFAYKRDWRFLPRFGPKAILARFAFSITVPWVVAINQIRGRLSSERLTISRMRNAPPRPSARMKEWPRLRYLPVLHHKE